MNSPNNPATKEALLEKASAYDILAWALHSRPSSLTMLDLETAIINTNNERYILYFAAYIETANRERLGEALRKSSNSPLLTAFLKLDISPDLKSKLEKQRTLASLNCTNHLDIDQLPPPLAWIQTIHS